MKLSWIGAIGLILSIADAQPRADQQVKGVPEAHGPRAGPHTISTDLLRQPLSHKAKHTLEKAQYAADSGDHLRAIGFLEAAHAKYPESDAWTQSMLGVEYLKTRQFASALTSLEKAVQFGRHLTRGEFRCVTPEDPARGSIGRSQIRSNDRKKPTNGF
jgi:hypothetical protein